MKLVNHIQDTQLKQLPEFKTGYTVRVHQKVIDLITDPKSGKVTGKKERAQVFEGLVIAKKNGKGITGTFTVRKISSGLGVERIFPLHSNNIVKLEVVRTPDVRKAKIYYVRERQDNSPRARKVKIVKK
ncbi:MAG: 50S ribosomal protein L19 [Candidatus Doudnabacteria bacterium]|nr:50S ribosomal protein L19 [Candidatus Doudnabacteria bacterium]